MTATQEDRTCCEVDVVEAVLPPPASTDSEATPEVTRALPEHKADTPVVAVAAVLDPEPQLVPTPLKAWQLCGDAVIGLAHRRNGLHCQDAVAFRSSPRPILALSDGAGSAAISERGAQALVIGITRLLRTLEDDLAAWLDGCDASPDAKTTRWAEVLRLHAQGLLADLARAERREIRDVRATLLVAVIGEHHVFWWQVGDGAIVVRNSEGMRALGSQARAKGEFANQTCFVDTATAGDVQCGLLPTDKVLGMALMSDGGAEKLVAHDGSKVARRLGEWLNAIAERQFSIDKIALAFHERSMWERTSLDDRSIVLAARCTPD